MPRGDRLGVFIEESGHAQFHPIARRPGGPARTASLSPDSRIILSGRPDVQDGDAVQVQYSSAAIAR